MLFEVVMATPSETEVDFVIDDAPPKPDMLRLTLKQKSMWQQFLDSTSGFTPEKFLEAFNDNKQKLVDKRRAGQPLTQDECDFLNKATQKNIEKVLDDFKKRAIKQMEIKPTDTAEELEFKLGFSEKVTKWLSDLFEWLIQKMQAIFAKLMESFDWCVRKTKELFDYLWSLFK